MVKDVAAAIIVRDAHVLMARRAPGQNLAGYWEFPGGKVEPGETIRACIARELAEELAITCEPGEIMMQHLHRYDGGAINLIAIHVRMTCANWRLSVHDDARWIGADALMALRLAPADIPVARAVRDELLATAGRRS